MPTETPMLMTDEGCLCSRDDFARDNAECLDDATLTIIYCLRIGETYSEPGGGSAAWSVTRVS